MFLSYAPRDMFAVVLYLNETTDRTGREQMDAFTKQLIDLCLRANGRFFLPYQVAYTRGSSWSSPTRRSASFSPREPSSIPSIACWRAPFVEKLEALLGQ